MDFDSFVLTASTADLGEEPAAREYADAVEFRMDLADAPVAAIEGYEGDLPLLVTNRVDWEGGERGDTAGRLDDLEAVLDDPAVEAVDLELAALEGAGDHHAGRVAEAAADAGVDVVVSTHDFEATPPRADLVDRLERACEHGTVGKIAVTAESRGDVLDLLAVTEEVTAAGNAVATMAMGEAGRHSRAVAPLYGSRIGYAPVDPKNATAPGQYDLETLRDLIDQLQSRERGRR